MSATTMAEPKGKPATPWQIAKAVLSGFFGVRSGSHDVQFKPLQIIIAGIIAAALFVCALLLLVNFIVSRAGLGG